MNYAPPNYWNEYFSRLQQEGKDLDWGKQWTGAFIEPLSQANSRTILDLGCGTGNDVLRLTQQGFVVTGLDYSRVGLKQAQAKNRPEEIPFVLADIAHPLPFPKAYFDAVMSNVAAHMFSDRVTRSIFAEIKRIIRPNGLFLFHLNALEDRPLRVKRFFPVCEIEENVILEQTGQTMHFFSKDYLLDLLADWQAVHLSLISIRDKKTGQAFKLVWRGIIRR